MFIVLQTASFNSYALLEAFVQIRDKAICNVSYSGAVTDNMFCAGSHYVGKGPCRVRSL